MEEFGDFICPTCSSSSSYVKDGYVYCYDCHEQSQQFVELPSENSAKPKSKKKNPKVVSRTDDWTTWEAYNYVLYGMTQQLKQLETSLDVERLVLQLWACYLSKSEVAFLSSKESIDPKLRFSHHSRDAKVLGVDDELLKAVSKCKLSAVSVSSSPVASSKDKKKQQGEHNEGGLEQTEKANLSQSKFCKSKTDMEQSTSRGLNYSGCMRQTLEMPHSSYSALVHKKRKRSVCSTSTSSSITHEEKKHCIKSHSTKSSFKNTKSNSEKKICNKELSVVLMDYDKDLETSPSSKCDEELSPRTENNKKSRYKKIKTSCGNISQLPGTSQSSKVGSVQTDVKNMCASHSVLNDTIEDFLISRKMESEEEKKVPLREALHPEDVKYLKKAVSSPNKVAELRKKSKLKAKFLNKAMLISVLHIALLLLNSRIQLSDLMRYIRESHLSFANVIKFLPENFKLRTRDDFLETAGDEKMPTHSGQRKTTADLIKYLSIDAVPLPDMHSLIHRYCIDLNLPEAIIILSERVIDSLKLKCPVEMKQKYVLPNFEGIAMASILYTMKKLFGLDGKTELVLSDLAEKLNRKKLLPCKDKSFVFLQWQKHIQCRKVMLSHFHYPTCEQLEYDSEETLPGFLRNITKIIRDGDNKKEADKGIVSKRTDNFMNSIKEVAKLFEEPVPEDEPIIFPPDLTPQTTYLKIALEAHRRIFADEIDDMMFDDDAKNGEKKSNIVNGTKNGDGKQDASEESRKDGERADGHETTKKDGEKKDVNDNTANDEEQKDADDGTLKDIEEKEEESDFDEYCNRMGKDAIEILEENFGRSCIDFILRPKEYLDILSKEGFQVIRKPRSELLNFKESEGIKNEGEPRKSNAFFTYQTETELKEMSFDELSTSNIAVILEKPYRFWIQSPKDIDSEELLSFNTEVIEVTSPNFEWLIFECSRMIEMNARDIYEELIHIERSLKKRTGKK